MNRMKEITMICCFVAGAATLAYGQCPGPAEPPATSPCWPFVVPGYPGVRWDVGSLSENAAWACGDSC